MHHFPGSLARRVGAHRLGGIALFYGVFMAVAFLTRLSLLAHSWREINHAPLALLGAFLCGLAFDLAAASLAAIPFTLYLAFVPHGIYARRWHRAFLSGVVFLTLYILLFSAVAEWFFWNEFGARFNFIAVDYLVYTHEVIGNIRESYPMPLILGGLGVAAAVGHLALWKWGGLGAWLNGSANAMTPLKSRVGWALALLAVPVVFASALNNQRVPDFGNVYNQELSRNGLYSFAAEFRHNELRYDQFYDTVDSASAFTRLRDLISDSNGDFVTRDAMDITRRIGAEGERREWNIIQITVESLSAKFLGAFGSHAGLTPNLDALARESLLFTRCYATGNRTVRGMEALTLSVPPTPGQSIVKRPGNENLFTLGSVLREQGYETSFIYGGSGYFDNMNHFFGSNGYKVVDRGTVRKEEITFENIWGACDEDVFHWTIKEADASYARGKPFHQFVMTTSNHRPFTYPDGRIDLPPKVSGRKGGVKYTDYAIGQLIKEARSRPWFTNTLFVIVADHCANSAGRTALPVRQYEIPLLIYNPLLVPAGKVDKLCSQIDVAPTLLGLMNWSYTSRFFGKDILKMHRSDERALIANYQTLGYLHESQLEILRPMHKNDYYFYDRASGVLDPRPKDGNIWTDAVAYYQTASDLFRQHRMGSIHNSPEKLAVR